MWGAKRMQAVAGVATAVALVVGPPLAEAKILRPWGSSLTGIPTLNTANGASHETGGRSTRHAVSPDPHDGADFTIWNTRLPGALTVAPRGGQVRAVKIKGCALKETTAPSQTSGGTPVNQINFQALAPRGGGAYKPLATAAGFHLPFCSSTSDPARGRTSTSTVTTFHPVHLCIAKGQTVNFYDIGGFIPNPSGPPWYPQGVPFEILSPLTGAVADSYADANASGGVYAPGARPGGANSGFASNPGVEVMLQVIEGVGADAYGLCPGGAANEPSNSNRVICVYHPPYDRHRRC